LLSFLAFFLAIIVWKWPFLSSSPVTVFIN
jgi:hypothetical protein